jgi:hypothetical protein
MPRILRLSVIPAKSPLANHGNVGIIKILLMMKNQSRGDFLTGSRPAPGAAAEGTGRSAGTSR